MSKKMLEAIFHFLDNYIALHGLKIVCSAEPFLCKVVRIPMPNGWYGMSATNSNSNKMLCYLCLSENENVATTAFTFMSFFFSISECHKILYCHFGSSSSCEQLVDSRPLWCVVVSKEQASKVVWMFLKTLNPQKALFLLPTSDILQGVP